MQTTVKHKFLPSFFTLGERKTEIELLEGERTTYTYMCASQSSDSAAARLRRIGEGFREHWERGQAGQLLLHHGQHRGHLLGDLLGHSPAATANANAVASSAAASTSTCCRCCSSCPAAAAAATALPWLRR